MNLDQLHPTRPGAIVYGPGQRASELQAGFARTLQARGFRVGGLVQQGMSLIALDTGEALSIKQELGSGSGSCAVDVGAVAQSTAALRRAIAERCDLVVVNKFAQLEAGGGGLADETLAAIAEGLPLLVSVPAEHLPAWLAVTGGHTDLLPPDPKALWRWWGAHRLYEDLVNGVEDAPVRRITVGPRFVMVESPVGVGLAARLCDIDAVPRETSLKALAQGLLGWDAAAATIGLAALNAHYNRFDLDLPIGDGLMAFPQAYGPVVVIGSFPGIAERRANVQVVDLTPGPGEYPAAAADWLLPRAGAALITSATLPNRTLPGLLDHCGDVPSALVGPGTPLTARLFDYGLDELCGFLVDDADGLSKVIAAGGAGRDFKSYGRSVVLGR